jgi:hypothetical protein
LTLGRVVSFSAVLALSIMFALLVGAAGAKPPKKLVAGSYLGETQEGGTVSFRLTSSGKILDFTLTKAKLYCAEENPPTFGMPLREPDLTKTTTIEHGPIQMRGASAEDRIGTSVIVEDPFPRDRAHEGGYFRAKSKAFLSGPNGGTTVNRGITGEVEIDIANGPTPLATPANKTPEWGPGIEWCMTKAIDWWAKKRGTLGYPPPYYF